MPPRVRRRFAQRFRFDSFDLLVGPEFEGRFTSEGEWQQLVDAMEGWYRVNGPAFEAEHAYPGSRSWAWWRFVAREAMPTPGWRVQPAPGARRDDTRGKSRGGRPVTVGGSKRMTFGPSETNEKEALMSADENVQDPRVRALRAAGEDRAADILEALAEGDQQQQSQEQEQEPQPKAGPPGIPLLSHDPAQRQAEAEGRLIGDRLMKSGIGQSWVSGGPLLGDGRADR